MIGRDSPYRRRGHHFQRVARPSLHVQPPSLQPQSAPVLPTIRHETGPADDLRQVTAAAGRTHSHPSIVLAPFFFAHYVAPHLTRCPPRPVRCLYELALQSGGPALRRAARARARDERASAGAPLAGRTRQAWGRASRSDSCGDTARTPDAFEAVRAVGDERGGVRQSTSSVLEDASLIAFAGTTTSQSQDIPYTRPHSVRYQTRHCC